MSVSNKEFLSYASAIVSGPAAEIEIRAAISRAYYCAYHSAKDFHKGLDSPGSAGADNCGVHETLIRQLTNPTVKADTIRSKSKSVGYLCRSLKGEREDADYDLKIEIPASTAQQVISDTNTLLQYIES